nr:unnamed protein product [Digitaria exilis]
MPAQGAVAGAAARSEDADAIVRGRDLGAQRRRSWVWLGVDGNGGLAEEAAAAERTRREGRTVRGADG